MERAILAALAFSGSWMGAVGWMCQLLNYPAFRDVASDRWAAYHGRHSEMISLIVGAPMLLQLGATLALFAVLGRVPVWFVVGSVLCLVFSFGWTAVVSGPMHGLLGQQDTEVIDRLVATNWPRSVAWTLQGVLAILVLSWPKE